MEQMILTAAGVAAAFSFVEQGKAMAKASRDAVKVESDNAVKALKALIVDRMSGKPDFMLPSIVGTVCASVEAEFIGAQPGTYRTVKNAIVAYVREGFTDLSLGRDAMKKAAVAAEQQRINGAEKARQAQVDAYMQEQESIRLAALEKEAAAAAAEKEAAAAEELARVAILWKNLQVECKSEAAQAAFNALVIAIHP